MKNQIHCLLTVSILTVSFITGGSMTLAHDPVEKLAPEQEAFWSMLFHHCGQAYRGEVTKVTQYYKDVVVDREFVLHFFLIAPMTGSILHSILTTNVHETGLLHRWTAH